MGVTMSPERLKETEEKRALPIILLTAVLIFSVMSAYTTQKGFSLIWDDSGSMEQFFMSWGIAIASSLLLIWLTLQIARRSHNRFKIALSYLIVASISIFFNFNTFYSKQTKTGYTQNDIRAIIEEINNIKAGGYRKVEEKKRKLQEEVDSLRALVQAEEEHVLRPGKGPIYQKKRERYLIKKMIKETYDKEMEVFRSKVEDMSQKSIKNLSMALEKNRTGPMNSALEKGLIEMNNIESSIKSFVPDYSYKKKVEIISNKSDTPRYSLFIIYNAIKYLFGMKNELSKEKVPAVVLAVFLSLILDLPIFLILFFMFHSSTDTYIRRKKSRKPYPDLWGRE
jgi:hypothetical protein